MLRSPRDPIYTGRTLSPQEALASGIVDEVVAPVELLARAQELARQLALIPPHVYRMTKQSLCVEALEQIDKANAPQDQAMLEVWSAAETHTHIREYLRRTLGK
jgi:enoyl-CoA hydratase